MKISVFWEISPPSPLNSTNFSEGSKLSQVRNQHDADSKHGVISQKIELIIVTAMRI
jgi:hypothetical protein